MTQLSDDTTVIPSGYSPNVTGENLVWLGNLKSGDVIKLDNGWKISDLVGESLAVQRAYWHCVAGYGIDSTFKLSKDTLPEVTIKQLEKIPEIRGQFFKVVIAAGEDKTAAYQDLSEESVVAVQCDDQGIEAKNSPVIHFNEYGTNSKNTAEAVPVIGTVLASGNFQASIYRKNI